MSEVTVTLNDVESRDVTARGEPATVYSFKTSDGRKYTTFKRDVAVPGSQLRGRLVTIDYKEQQKGEYTNYYLNSIKLADTGEVAETVRVTTADSAVEKVFGPSDKDTSIARAVALKAAVETAVGLQLGDADQNAIIVIAGVYAEWLLTGAVTPVKEEAFPF